ncbi:MAG: large repetitive protein, partial [Kribbellaceae bacterium]|nr:large repetitive protein [Kribbellaceae bacterium]
MPRPGDWDAIGLGGDPTPGDPEKIKALAEGFQKMGGKAREIITAIEAVMNKNDDSVFVGDTAEALRGKVDKRLRGHVESVASAFESSATALREWSGVVVEQQAKADAALNAGRGLAEDDPERDNHKNTAKAAGDYQSEQASSYAGRINGVSDIKMPISDCEVFWEAFKWLAIILIIPALIFGGPIALIALGVNLALFIKTIVDVAKGDASFLDLFLAGLGLIAPTTKALPIFSIVKAIGKGIGAGVKGIVQTFKNVFSKDFLFNGLLAGLKSMPILANIAIKETGLFVVKNIRNFPLNAANFGNNFGKIALNGIKNLGTGFANLPGTLFRGLTNIGKGFATGLGNTFKFVDAHFGNLQWTRIFLPVAADEIRAFRLAGMTDFGAFTQALKVGVIGRGIQSKNLFGMPMTSAIGKSIAGIPIETTGGALGGKTNFLHTMMNPPEMIPLNIKGLGDVSGAGFNAGHVNIAIGDIPTANMSPIKSGDFGISVHTPTVTTPTGIHIPANAGTNMPVVPSSSIIPSAHIGAPQMPSNVVANLVQPQVGTPVLPIHIATGATPPSVHVNTSNLGANGLVANLPSPHVGTPEFGNSLHLNNVNVQSPGLNNIGSLHVPTPNANSAGLSDLAGSAIRNNAPAVSPHFGTSIGEGAAHGFQANHFKLSIDEVLNAPSGASFNGIHALNPPAVDRINAALDLVHNPGATTQGVTPPSIHTAKPAGTDVNVNVHLNGGADFKPPAPATIKIDNPGLAGAQNAPTVPSVNIQPVNLPSRAADLHIQPTTVHNTGQGTTLPSTNLPGNVGVPGHGLDAKAAMPDTQLVPLHPQPAPAVHNNPGVHSPGVDNSGFNAFDSAGLHNPGLHNSGLHNPGMHNPGVRDPGYSLAKGADIGNSGHGTNTIASHSEIQLHGLTDRPGAYVKVERTEGGMTSYNLYGGGPDGRMDVLAGGNLRFTDTATGQTTRFDSGGIVLDQGLRLTKTDGVLRPADHIVVTKGGEFRATSLTGDLAPDIKISKLDNGGIQLIDEKGVTFHYNAQGKLENQPLSAAWDKDLAAKAGVFRQPGDTDAMVNAKMADFGQVQRAQAHFDNALDNVAVHGGRLDGPSTGPAVGDQVHLDLRAAENDLATAKATFEGKHNLSVDNLQQQLDKLTIDSLKERPRLLGGVGRSFDLPNGNGMKFELNGGQISFSGPKADAFSSTLNGRTLTITETGGAGQAAHTWTYSLGFGGRANQIGESFPLNGGLFEGQPIHLQGAMGQFDKALVTDLRGNHLPVKFTDDGFVVPSPQGPLQYDRGGNFHGVGPSTADHLPKPPPPAHLGGDDLIRWNAQADISRTHLTLAAGDNKLDLFMKGVAGGTFTSKKGFDGYINPSALRDGTLVGKVHSFENFAKELAFKGPEDNLTVYRGVSMDPASAQAGKFTERLPISTSNTMKFQDEWARNGVNTNRVVFEIDVPAGHSKMSMAYPDGYQAVKGDAPEINASQFEVTLSPTTLVRTGPNRTLDNGMTVIPVKAEQIPPSMYESVITAKWPGMPSETAFGDFVKSFELGALKQFPDLDNVTSKSLQSTDGLTHTVTVSKPGFEGHDLTITVMRDPKADTVRVTIASDGANKFDQTWTKTDFSNIATDLRGGVLHNNEKFTNFPKPWQWEKATPFRADGLSEAQVLQRMDDWAGVEKAQIELDSIKRDFGPQTGRVDGSSNAPSVGDQARLEIQLAEQQLVEAKATFTQLHNLDADATADWLAALKQSDLKLNPGLLGASGRPGRGIDLPGADGVQLVRDGRNFKLAGDGADQFHLQTGADGNMVIQKLGDGGDVLHSWTMRPGFRPSVIAETLTLGDGPLAGKFLDLQGTAGKLDGVIDDVRGGLPAKADSDGIVVATPGGVFKYDRDGFFQGPGTHPGDQLGTAVPPPHLSGEDATRWTAQADLSRTHLGEAMTNKPVENLMKDVAGGSFTSKKGYGGFINPTALEDGTLLGKMQTFHNVTQDLLTKGPADNITLYRGVSMDPAAAKANEFTERLPISTSSSVKFQDEWAKNGVNSNRVVFEIDVPPAHNKLSMSYPEGYKPAAGEAKAWNQDQFEVTLAPTTFVRTGPNRTLDNGITVIPVKAELIPPSAYNDVINQKWGGLSSATAFDDFAKSFELNALRQFPDLESVTSKSVLSGDGMINKITVSKPGFEGHDMHITVTRDPQADSVRVTVDADGATKFDKSWSGQQFSNLATDLRGGVLHNNEQFTNLPQPARWADEAASPVHIDVKGKGKAVDQGSLGNDLASLNRSWDNDVASLNKAWADDIEAFNKAWADDLAAKTNVFRMVGDTDAVVDARMADFSRVEHAQGNVKAALDDIAQHGGRLDGASTRPEIGEQAHLQLSSAETDLANAKAAFEGKHGMKVDAIQKQLDKLLLDSLRDRPRLPGAGMRRPMPISGTDGMFKIEGNSVNFFGDSAGDFRGVLDGTALTVTKVDAEGNVLRTLSYQLNDLGWPMMKTDQIVLHGGGDVFDGRALTAEWNGGSFGHGAVDDLGDNVPVKYNTGEGEYSVPSMSGTQVYDRTGTFVRVEPGAKGKLADPIPPIHLEGDDLARWTAQADLSRTHLAAAEKYDYIGDMMQMAYEGRFTSQKGFGGYLDPYVLETGVTKLTKDVHTFNEVAEGLLFDGPIAPTTVYRGIAMDSASAQGNKFVERLPVSTSTNWEFQKTWAKGADPGKRVVFQIDVPPAHGKLALSYPEGYQQGLKDARAWNPDQLEMTLSPTVLERTGDSFVKDGLTVIPVRARQIPAGQLDNLISERWPGMSSADAFDDFGRAFEQVNLQKFSNMSDVTATSKVSTDGMVREITVSKPGLPGHDLTIKITRNEFADSVHVTVTADGKISLNRNWSQTGFSSIATDLRAGTLHQNDLFVGMSKPAEWNKPTSLNPQWDADLAAKADVFRKPGDTDALVDAKMEDFSRFQQTETNLKHALDNIDLHGARPDGPSSSGVSVGDEVRMDLDGARADLDTAKIGFKRKYDMDPDQLKAELGDAVKRPRLPGAGRSFEVPGGGVSYQVEGGAVQFTGTRAGEFTGSVNGREITVTQLGANGETLSTWTFRQGFGRPNLTGQTIHLADGPLAGEVANLKGLMGQLDGTLNDGGVWPMKVVGDELFVATPGGPVRYGRDGAFHGPAPTSTSHLPQPTLPGNLHGDPVRWTNQVDLSRTHLTAAAENKAVENLMKDVMGGSFTSKRGFEGYVNPLALEDGTLVGKVQTFADVTRDLLLKGGDRDVTLYRGVSMDPASAKANEFVDRLPSSTSNNIKFQEEWAKNGVASNRFVFEIDVPAGHGKLSMSYPPGYQAGLDEARAWNQSQWEVTLAPTTLVRTGPNRVENGMTIIPVKAEAIAPSAYTEMITAKWPGMKSSDAFTDFAKSFERDNLRKFTGLENVSTTTVKRADSLTITAAKPGFDGDLKITVLRDAEADSVRVTVTSDGMTTFDRTWSKTDFKHLATDLRGNVLHNNDLFAGRMEPASWKAAPSTPSAPVWDADRMARMDVLRKVGDSDASLTVRMDDFTGVQQAQADFHAAAAKYDGLVSRADGSSKGPSIADQAKIDLQTAQDNLDLAKNAFDAKHGMQFDGLQQQLDDLLTGSLGDRPRIVAAGRDTGQPSGSGVRMNPMGGGPTKLHDLPAQVQIRVQGGQAQIVGGLDQSIHLNQLGNELTLTRYGADGVTTMHTWEYRVMRNGSLTLTGESVQLTHGALGGRVLTMGEDGFTGNIYAGAFDDGLGAHWPVKANGDTITIASPGGALSYDRSTGLFRRLDQGLAGNTHPPAVPQHLTDLDAAARWTGSVELSRTHLAAASVDANVMKLMGDVRDGSFTSQRGYRGFVDLAHTDADTLVEKVDDFVRISTDLTFHGPNARVTLYRGMSLDPVAARADNFVERLPSSTSNGMEFQHTWAQNGDKANRVVFEIDVPGDHAKLASAYPPHYELGLGDAAPVNPHQFEVTLAPTNLVRTGDNRIQDGLTIIPVKAEQLPQNVYDDLIHEEWGGFTSHEAFGDFGRAFSADGLRRFQGMADVSATSTISHDGLVNTIKVSKPNSADDLTIVVSQKGPHTVSVEAGFNGERFFEGSWSKAEYMHFATDLRSGMLHNSDVFAGRIDPLSWRQAATQVSQTWSSDMAARANLFRQLGDSDALVLTRMDDFQAVQKTYDDFAAAARYGDDNGANPASTSTGLSIGDRAKFDLHAAQEKFVLAKQTFEAQHPQLSADGLLRGLEDLRIASVNDRPRGVGAGGYWSKPEANTTGYHVVEGNRTIHYDSSGTLTEVHFSLNGTTDRFVVRDADGLHVLGDGADDFAVRGLDDGGFRIYDADGHMQRYGPDGVHLGDGVSVVNGNGFRGDRFVEVDGVVGARLVDLQGTHVPGTTVDLLPDGGFRVNGAQGNSARYGVDGVLVADGVRLTDPQGLRGALFTEPNGTDGLRVVDVNGRPVPNTHTTHLPNGQTMVVDDGLHDVQWFGRDGVREGIGVRALHADFPNNPVFVFRAEGGNVSFVDNLGAQLPHQVDVLQGGGFRITDPANGIARTFDDAGAAIDRRIPLHQPGVQPGQQLVVVHDVHGNVSIRTGADAPGPGAVELTGNGGYRAIDGGNYHVYDANGAHHAHGVAVTLHGEDGFLEIGAAGAQRVDAQYASIAGRQVNFDAARGEITVGRAGGEDIFNLQGVPLRQITDLDGLGASQLGGRVTRAENGAVSFVDNAGAAMPNRYHATVDAQGNVRVELQLNGSPRNGEYHVYNRAGNLTEQGFPVLNNGEATPFRYVVDRVNSTWTRTGGTRADGVFQHGKVEVTGVGNGQIKLISSSAKEVQVFERRWLPGGEILDSFRKTDTLGFGTFNRRTTWATYDNAGGVSNWGKREFDTSGNSWLDVDHNGRSVHHYQQGLQKYDNPIADEIGPMGKAEKEITGHVLATRGADGNWTWNRFDADGTLIGSGQRTWEKLGDGFTDHVRLPGQTTDDIAQQKWGTWNST